MRPNPVVIGRVVLQNATQLRFVEHDQVIKALTPNRSDEALDVAVLPRRAWRGRMIADAHRVNAMGVSWAEGSIAVANQMTRCFIPREGVGHLPSDPLGSRIGSDADRDHPPAGVTQDHQAVEQLERDSAYDEEVQRSDARNVIAQESLPTLGRWSPAPDHIPADGRFSDFDSKHQQFAVDPRCTPQRVLAAHPPNKRSNLTINSWTAADVAELPAPVGAEPASMPADHGLRLDDDDRVQQRRIQSIQPYHQQAIDVPKSHPRRGLASQNYAGTYELEVLAKHYFNEQNQLHFEWEAYGSVGGSELRFDAFAGERLAQIKKVLGQEALHALLAQDLEKWKAEFRELEEQTKRDDEERAAAASAAMARIREAEKNTKQKTNEHAG